MAFITIPAESIEVGRALKKSLFTLIKDNLDDLNTRVGENSQGIAGTLPLVFTVNGDYNLTTAAQRTNMGKTVLSADITISDVFLHTDEAGGAGTTEINISKNTVASPTVYSSLLTTNPTVGFGAGDDAVSTDGVVNPSNDVVLAGETIKLTLITSQEQLPRGLLVRIEYSFN